MINLFNKCVFVYLDKILIFSPYKECHMQLVLQHLLEHQLFVRTTVTWESREAYSSKSTGGELESGQTQDISLPKPQAMLRSLHLDPPNITLGATIVMAEATLSNFAKLLITPNHIFCFQL